MKCASTAPMWTKRLLQLFPSCQGRLWRVFFFSLSFFWGGGGRYTFSVERLSDPHVLNYFAIPFPIVFSAMPPLPASEVSWKSGGSVAEKLVFLKKIALSLQLFGRRASSRLQC